jgi:hypothetical protein
MGLMQSLRSFLRRIAPPGGSEFLCDTCKYDHPSACRRPERPNARECPDYKRKGT